MRNGGMYLRRRQEGGKVSDGETAAQMIHRLLLMWRWLMSGLR